MPSVPDPSLQRAVQAHVPTPDAQRRAEAAGLDLEALKARDPVTYAILNAERAVRVSPHLKEEVGGALFRVFPEHQVFELPSSQRDEVEAMSALLIFPPLGRTEAARLDDTLAALAETLQAYAFYRTVSDMSGEHRELGLPVPPDAWRGETDVMVGPFECEAAARAWSEAKVPASAGLISDVLRYRGAWFCDLFRGDTSGV